MTRWRWHAISPEIRLTLTLDSDDPELVARVERSAEANGIRLVRVQAGTEDPAPLMDGAEQSDLPR